MFRRSLLDKLNFSLFFKLFCVIHCSWNIESADLSWSARMIPRCKEGHRHAASLFAEVKGLTGHWQHIFMHLFLDTSHPGPFTASPPLIPTYISHWVALLKCWKSHRNMNMLFIRRRLWIPYAPVGHFFCCVPLGNKKRNTKIVFGLLSL